MYRITLHVDPYQNLWGESYLYTGLALTLRRFLAWRRRRRGTEVPEESLQNVA